MEWEFGIMEDCTNKTGETFLAVSTLELIVPIRTYVSMCTSTERTYYATTPTLLSDEITATLVIIEVSNE